MEDGRHILAAGMGTRDPLLIEREKTHGDFRVQGAFAQDLKKLLRRQPCYSKLLPSQAEALDSICTKLSRIVCGSTQTIDHWDDIAGYAKLGAEACE